MNKLIWIVGSICIIVIISNFIPDYDEIGKSYKFTTLDKDFIYHCVPSKGRDVKLMEKRFKEYKKRNDVNEGIKLYRTFKIKIWKFWKWRQYLTYDVYDYPYIEKHN